MPRDDAPKHELVNQIKAAAAPVLFAMSAGDPVAQQYVGDFLNTVIAKVLGRAEKQPPIDNIAAYSAQVARTVFNDWLRYKLKHPEARPPVDHDNSAEWFDQVMGPEPKMTPASLIVHRDDQRRHAKNIAEALDALNGSERAVIFMRYQEGRSSADVAAALGYKSAAVVDTTAARARRKIEAVLLPSLIEQVIPVSNQQEPGPALRRRPRADRR